MAVDMATLSWILGVGTITAYSFNSQVFVWIGSRNFGGKLFELVLFHLGMPFFLLYFVFTGGWRELLEPYTKTSKDTAKFLISVCIAAFFLLEIYYLWYLASIRIPTSLVAAIFQCSVAFVYVLSLVFLNEVFSWSKLGGVALALIGMTIASFGPRWFGGSEEPGADASFPTGKPLVEGVFFAVCAELSKAVYQVWFKATFGSTPPKFALLFGSLIGVAQVFPVLPVIAILDACGVKDARMSVAGWDADDVLLIMLAATIAATVNIGTLAVVSLRSPIFWAAVQMLAIPISMVFDFTINTKHIKPNVYSCIGYVFIAGAFVLLTDVLRPAKARVSLKEDLIEAKEKVAI